MDETAVSQDRLGARPSLGSIALNVHKDLPPADLYSAIDMRVQLLILLSFAGLLSLCCAEAKLSDRHVAVLADMLKGGNGYGQTLNDRAIRTPWT